MELTLTGASLTSDTSRVNTSNTTSTSILSSNKNSSTTNAAAASHQSCSHTHDHSSHDHSHHHHHSHQQQQQVGPASNYQRVEAVPKEKLLSNPQVLFSALIAAIKGGSFETFKYLVDLILQHEQSNGALQWGTKFDDTCQSSLGNRGPDGHTLAHWASKRSNNLHFLQYLCDSVKDINIHCHSADAVGMTPLHWAATEGTIPIVNLILTHLDQTRSNGFPHSSSRSNMSGLGVEIHPTSHPINTRDKSGCTPLLIAAQYGHADLAAFLIKRGADPLAVDDSKDTALHWAAYKGSVSVCGLLLHLNGIEGHLDELDAFCQTPLHLAALRGNTDVIDYIMEQSCTYELNKRNQDSGDIEQGSSKHFAEKLLTMIDKDGKTPIDLAIKKKKDLAEMLLKKYMDKYCTQQITIGQKIVATVKPFFSCKNWLSWIGLVSENGNPPRFIFWFVVINLALAFMMELVVYTNFFHIPGIRGEDRLADCMYLHYATIFNFLLTWFFFIMVNKTDPGILAEANYASAPGNAMRGIDACLDFRLSPFCIWNENKKIKREMHTLTNDLRNLYEETLESFADAASNGNDTQKLPLCHSCHIARPHRSKHCRVLNRCVLVFDHHCPFVGNTIGLYNYKYFYPFVVFMTIANVLFTSTGFLYLRSAPTGTLEVGKWLLCIYWAIYTFMTGGLSFYHTQLVTKNLTTNEHANFSKYAYLKKEDGKFTNPYDFGCFKNFTMRFTPSKSLYMTPNFEAQLNGSNMDMGRPNNDRHSKHSLHPLDIDSSINIGTNKKDDEKLSLVENVV